MRCLMDQLRHLQDMLRPTTAGFCRMYCDLIKIFTKFVEYMGNRTLNQGNHINNIKLKQHENNSEKPR